MSSSISSSDRLLRAAAPSSYVPICGIENAIEAVRRFGPAAGGITERHGQPIGDCDAVMQRIPVVRILHRDRRAQAEVDERRPRAACDLGDTPLALRLLVGGGRGR